MRKAALFFDYAASDGEVFGKGRRERIAQLVDVYPDVVTVRTFAEHAPLRYQVTRQVFQTMG